MYSAATIWRYGTTFLLLWVLFTMSNSGAETDSSVWNAEVYGGEYYDDKRAGAYLVSSENVSEGSTFIAELLHEQYTGYRYSGVGGHILWSVENLGDLGFAASQAWETYDTVLSTPYHYQTRLLGVEWEYKHGQVALAAQGGKYLRDYSGKEHSFLSADGYYSGVNEDWYLRASTRRIGSASLNLLEAYRTLYAEGRAVTIYAGLSSDHLNSIAPSGNDSAYAGSYVSLFSNAKTNLTLWFELAQGEKDALVTLELNLAFGPGARNPYISSFGYSIDN